MTLASGVAVELAAGAVLGEGVVWDVARRELVWVDIERGAVHRYDPASGSDDQISLDGRVGFAAPCASGGLVVGVEHTFARLDPGGELHELARVEPDAPTRLNDGNCDRRGRLYAGTMDLAECSPVGALYRLDPDGTIESILEGVTVSNGLDWNDAGDTMYYVDSATGTLDALDFDEDTGRVSGRRALANVGSATAMPDGLTVDSEGFIWVALWGGWSVRRFSPSGGLDRVVRLPTAHVTSCGFGGPALDQLYISSAREGLAESELAEQPLAGALFRHSPAIVGRKQHQFGG